MRKSHAQKGLFLTALLLIQSCDSDSVDPSDQTTRAGNIETIAGQGPTGFGFEGDGGPAKAAKLGFITAIATDKMNNVYVTDGAANVVRKINSADGKISTIAGTFLGFNVVDPTPYAGDGGSANNAHLNFPLGIAVDHIGNVIIVDGGNGVIRKIDATTGIISTVAGTGAQGFTGDDGPATSATFFNPYDVAVDGQNNIYIADAGNNAIRKITIATGIITTLAGLGQDEAGYSGDNGPATSAKLNYPTGVAVDQMGNIYIADANHVIRKIHDGIITTVAGNGIAGYTGDGGAATNSSLKYITRVAVDEDGNIYIADAGNTVIRKVTVATGIITTYAGNGVYGYAGDGGAAVSANLAAPWDLVLDGKGNLYIADTNNSAVRVVAK